MKKKKRILYFIIGGHGGQVFMEQWQNKDVIHDIVLNVVDWGGHTGVLGRCLESRKIHFLPLGDLRNNLGNLFLTTFKDHNKKLGESLSNTLQKRVSNITEIKNEIKNLIKIAKTIPQSNIKSTLNYKKINEFIDIYIESYKKLPAKLRFKIIKNKPQLIKHCVGNIFLAALAFSLKKDSLDGGYTEMLNFLKEIKFISENINFYFIDKNRKNLSATFTVKNSQVELIGEDLIDEHNKPIHLKDFKLLDPNTSKANFYLDISILELIINCDLIIIPPGSETNTYPWFAHSAKLIAKLKKPVYRIVNFAKEKISFGITEEMLYLHELGLEVIYLFPKSSEILNRKIEDSKLHYLKEIYEKDGKSLQFFNKEELKTNLLKTLGNYNSYKNSKKISSQELINKLLSNSIPLFDLNAFDGSSLKDSKSWKMYDIQMLSKGFRHKPEQIALFCSDIINKNIKTS